MPQTEEWILRLRDQYTKKLKQADKTARSFEGTNKKIGGILKGLIPLAGAAGAALVFKSAVKVAIQFEKEMSNVRAISQANQKEFQALEQQAQQLGRTTQFSAKQSAEAMSFLAMAGFDVNQVMKALPGTLDLAAAGSINLGRAADIASNVLTQFGLAASEMNRVNDVIVKTTTRANVNVEQLAEGLKYTGTTAKILKMPLEETAAALGVLGNAGLQGSMGGTSLNFALLEMSRQSSPTAKKLKKLGVETRGVNGEFVGLTNILDQFEKLGIGSTTILDTFGVRGGRAMGTLVEAGSGAIKTLTKLNKESKGIAKTVAKMKIDNLAGDITILKSAAQGLAISFGRRMNPAMRDSVKLTTKLVNKFEEWVRVPIAEELRKEGVQAAVLVGKLRNVNLKEDERFRIIEKLKEISPELVKGIDSENVSIKQLTNNLRAFNKQQAKRIVLAGLELKEQKLIAKEASRREKIEAILTTGIGGGGLLGVREFMIAKGFEKEAEKFNDFIKAIEAGDVKLAKQAYDRGDFLGFSKTDAKTAIRQLEKINAESANQIDIAARIKRLQDQLGIGDGGAAGALGDKATITGTITPDKSAKKLEQKITSAAPKVFNINIGKLIETQEIKVNTLKEGSNKIKQLVTEALLEGLNETQTMVAR